MTTSHTPGPWHCTALPRLPLLSTFILDADGDPRALPVTPANAALIAAAPELLAALQYALERFECIPEHKDETGVYRRAAAIARAAIARATGQA